MTALLVFAFGAVLAVEGLIMALLPGRLHSVLQMLENMTAEQRRLAGLAALALGVVLIWLARSLGL